MRFSKSTIRYLDDLVYDNAKFDKTEKKYYLDINNISPLYLSELAGHIMQDDPMLASEATGPDNQAYDRYMLPALTKFLCNSDDDNKYDYLCAWQDGVVSYLRNTMQMLLDERVSEYQFYKETEQCAV